MEHKRVQFAMTGDYVFCAVMFYKEDAEPCS